MLCFVVCSSLLAMCSQAQTSSRFFFSADGQEVMDSKSNLIWRRCVEGMEWDGTTCAGSAITLTQEEALLRSTLLTINAGIAWRLPKEKELFSIANKTGISPEVSSSSFPETPPSWFWTDAPVVGVPDYFLSVGFCDDGSGVMETKSSVKNYVRFVHAGQ